MLYGITDLPDGMGCRHVLALSSSPEPCCLEPRRDDRRCAGNSILAARTSANPLVKPFYFGVGRQNARRACARGRRPLAFRETIGVAARDAWRRMRGRSSLSPFLG